MSENEMVSSYSGIANMLGSLLAYGVSFIKSDVLYVYQVRTEVKHRKCLGKESIRLTMCVGLVRFSSSLLGLSLL
jgi:hypothetical protein